MKSEWRIEPLQSVVAYIAKGIPPVYVECEGETTIRVLNQKCNRDFAINYADSRLHDFSKRNVPREKLLRNDDILINSTGTGTAGRIAQLNTVPYPTIVDGHMIIIRPNEKVIPRYLGYALKAQQSAVLQLDEGSTGQTELNRERLLSEILISYPVSTFEQQVVADTLSALDAQIATNKAINHHLEQMAQAIFKSWFVDFEPFGGMIPDDWREVPLGSLVQSIDNRGKTPPLSSQPTDYPIIDVKALSGFQRVIDFNNCTKFVDVETYNSWFRSGHPQHYDILLSTVGSLAEMKLFFGTRGCIAQNVVGFRSKMPLYLYQYLQYIKDDLVSYNIGSVQPSIKVSHIIKHPIIVPTDNVLNRFNELVEPLTNEIYTNHCQSEHLNSIRNSLLPRLMSGELSVADI